MNIRPNTYREGTSIIVRWTLDGEYDHGYGPAEEGVEVPDDAVLIDMAFEPSQSQTQQIVFEPAWPGELAR